MSKLFSAILFSASVGMLNSMASAATMPADISAGNAVETQIPTPKIEVNKPSTPAAVLPADLQEKLKEGQKQMAHATLDDVKKDIHLASTALNIGMLRENWPLVEAVLPIYRKFPNADPILIDYAQGALYREKGEYKKAIALYRKLIAENPNMLRVRMDLAILLYADYQDIAAKDQFIKLRSDPKNDDYINKIIDNYLNAISKRAAWSFNAGVSYLQDDNVNNASASKTITLGNLVFQKEPESLPRSAHGFDFSLGVSKDFNLSGSNYLSLDANSFGKIYWDNHQYDDLNFRLGVGYKYQDARNTLALTPFMKRRYVHGDAYSKTYGLSLSESRWFNPNFQLSNYNEIAWEKSDIKPDERSERQLFANINALWAPKATQYFSLGGSIFDVKNQSRTLSYTRPGVNLLWNQDWSYGISSRINLGYGHKAYKGLSIFGIKRKDNEYNAGLTLWNRDWHFFGITPKLAFRYNKINSNIDDLYSYDKATVFLKFDKTF